MVAVLFWVVTRVLLRLLKCFEWLLACCYVAARAFLCICQGVLSGLLHILSGCCGVLSGYQGVAMQLLKCLERLLTHCYVVARAFLCSYQGVLVG